MQAELFEAISPSARKWMYLLYGLVGITLGAVQVGFSSAELFQPTWVTVALAVYAFLGSSFGITAYSNVRPKASPSEPIAGPIEDELDASLRS